MSLRSILSLVRTRAGFGILEVRAPHRISGTLTGTLGQSRDFYCTPSLSFSNQGQTGSSLSLANFSKYKNH
jgi:hypothetical protein